MAFLMNAFLSSLILSCVAALPTPQDGTVNGFNPVTIESLGCTLDFSTPDNARIAWDNIGLSVSLDAFLKDQSGLTADWANNFERNLTGSDTALRCDDISDTSACGPIIDCDPTQAQAFFFRKAIHNAQQTIFDSQQSFLEQTMLNAINPDSIVQDFPGDLVPIDESKSQKIFEASVGFVNNIFGVFDPALGKATTAFSGIFGGVLGLIDNLNPGNDPLQPVEDAVKSALAQTFSNITQAHTLFATALFANGDVSSVPNLSGQNGETQPIAQFFSGGKFLLDPPNLAGVNGTIASTLTQQIVTQVLIAGNQFVFVDTTQTADDCANQAGSAFIDGQCFTIQVPNQSGDFSVNVGQPIIDKLQGAPYNIDIFKFLFNANDCTVNHGQNGGPGDLDVTSTDANGLPTCFFNLPVLKINGGNLCSLVTQSGPAQTIFPTGSSTANLCSLNGGSGESDGKGGNVNNGPPHGNGRNPNK